MKEVIEYQLFRGLAFIIQSISLRNARRLARFLGCAAFYFIPIRRAITLQQLRSSFPDLSEKRIHEIALESYINLMTMMIEMMWIPKMTDEILAETLHINNPEIPLNLLKKGRGLIYISGHVGNWELMAHGAARLMRTSFTSIIHPQHNQRIAKFINDIRCSHGNRVVDMKMGIRGVITILRERGIVAIMTDQSGPSNAVFMPFFGRLAATYEGPAALALKLNVPLVMVICIRQPNGNYEVFVKEVDASDLQGASEENIRELTRRHVKLLEEYIRAYPGQWLWQHKRWKHRPPQLESAESPTSYS